MSYLDWVMETRIEHQWRASLRHHLSPMPSPCQLYHVGFVGLSELLSNALYDTSDEQTTEPFAR